MNLFGLTLTIVVLIGIAAFILVFERQRATRIERDLHVMNEQRHKTPPPPTT